MEILSAKRSFANESEGAGMAGCSLLLCDNQLCVNGTDSCVDGKTSSADDTLGVLPPDS